MYRSRIVVKVIKSRRLRWAGHASEWKKVGMLLKLTGTPTGQRTSGRPRRRWEDKTRMDLKEIGVNTRNWDTSAQDRDYWRALVNGVS